MRKKLGMFLLIFTFLLSFMPNVSVYADTSARTGNDFTVNSTFNLTSLQPNSMLDAKTTVTNNKSSDQSVMAMVALYDANDAMVNMSYISKSIAVNGTENLNTGFKLPSNVNGYKVKVFVWDGTNLVSTKMQPLSNVVTLGTENKDEEINDWKAPVGFDTKKPDVKYGNLQEVSYNSTTTGTTRKCFVITPANYDKTKKYPVLYLLHGIGGTDSEWLGGDPVTVIGNLVAKGEASDMIVVMPNIRAMANDGVPKDILGQENINACDNFINDLKNDLMPFINKNYSVSTEWKDTAIAGLSMGGRESLYIGFSMPDTFAYIGAFSPAPGLLPDAQLGYPGQFKEEDFKIPSGKNTPNLILICNGNTDHTVGTIPTTYHETLEKNGVKHLWYTIDGDHDFTVWKNGLYNFTKLIFKSK